MRLQLASGSGAAIKMGDPDSATRGGEGSFGCHFSGSMRCTRAVPPPSDKDHLVGGLAWDYPSIRSLSSPLVAYELLHSNLTEPPPIPHLLTNAPQHPSPGQHEPYSSSTSSSFEATTSRTPLIRVEHPSPAPQWHIPTMPSKPSSRHSTRRRKALLPSRNGSCFTGNGFNAN